MDQKTMTIKCFRCGKTQLMLEMVMDASGRGMVCKPCAGLKPRVVEPSRPVSAREQFAKPSPGRSGGKYACTNCKYRFSSSKSIAEVSCPYCGSRRLMTPEENSAESLLRSAGSREFDF